MGNGRLYKVSEETKRKISLSLKGRIPKNINTIAGWNRGKKMSQEQRDKISKTLKEKGIKPKVRFMAYGEKHPLWKSSNVSYSGLHYWIRRKLGKPKVCEFCGEDKKRMTWANKSWEYKRTLDDWLPLCYSCHKKYDLNRE